MPWLWNNKDPFQEDPIIYIHNNKDEFLKNFKERLVDKGLNDIYNLVDMIIKKTSIAEFKTGQVIKIIKNINNSTWKLILTELLFFIRYYGMYYSIMYSINDQDYEKIKQIHEFIYNKIFDYNTSRDHREYNGKYEDIINLYSNVTKNHMFDETIDHLKLKIDLEPEKYLDGIANGVKSLDNDKMKQVLAHIESRPPSKDLISSDLFIKYKSLIEKMAGKKVGGKSKRRYHMRSHRSRKLRNKKTNKKTKQKKTYKKSVKNRR